mgnify:CR=1 FL=1
MFDKLKDAVVSTKVLTGKENDPEAAKFKDYFEWSEPLAKAPSHRVLAMRRGEKEMFLLMRVQLPDETAGFAAAQSLFVKAKCSAADQVSLAVQDSCKRLIAPAMETEMRALVGTAKYKVATAVCTASAKPATSNSP